MRFFQQMVAWCIILTFVFCVSGGFPALGPGVAAADYGDLPASIAEQFPGYQVLDGIETEENEDDYVYLCRTPEDDRVLLCCWTEGNGLQAVESSILPPETKIVFEEFSCPLIDTGIARFRVRRYHEDQWGLYTLDEFDLFLGPHWIGWSPNQRELAFGDHPWSDVRKIDWSQLTSDALEVSSRLDRSRVVMIDKADDQFSWNGRTGMYAQPDENSKIIANLANGTFLFIRETNDEWTHACLGREDGSHWVLDGWIRTSELTFSGTKLMNRYPDELAGMGVRGDSVTLIQPDGSYPPQTFDREAWRSERFQIIGEMTIEGKEYYLAYSLYSEIIGCVAREEMHKGHG